MTKKRRKSYSRQPVLRRRKNGVFYIHHQYQGRQVRQSTRTRLRAEAEEQLAQYRKSLTGNQKARSINLTVWQGIEGWLADRMAPRLGLQPSTLAGYKTFAKKLKSVVPPGLLVRDLVRSDIRSALDRLFDKGNSQIQIAKCGTTFSQVCNYLVVEGHLTHNPCVKVCKPAKYSKRSAMPKETYEALMAALERECSCPGLSSASRKSRRDLRDLVELCWGSGLRFIEMTRMTWKDIDFDELTFQTHSPGNKGGELTRPMTGSASEVLLRRTRSSSFVFPGTHARMMTAWQRFKQRNPEFRKSRMHDIRRTFITRIHCEFGPARAMVMAGHSSPEMTGRYTDPQLVDLKSALSKF